jgi:kumamolisin
VRRSIVASVLAVAVVFTMGAVAQKLPGSGQAAAAAAAPAGPHNWITPASSVERAADAGLRAHTNWVFGSANGQVVEAGAQGVGNFVTTTQHYETPSSMACLYKIPGNSGTCIPSFAAGTGGPQKGGWGAIAIVDAYDNPHAASELATFDSFWGLPAANFVKVYANGNGSCTTPPADPGWGLEESLDIEWAHVMAPKATIILVEACSASFTDLLYAEYVAGGLVASYGGGDVTNSWGSSEFAGETSYDVYFGYYYFQNTAYFASAGDSGCGAAYPSSSPWLVSAGGTTVNRSATTLAFKSESCWAGSGGGVSSQETWSNTFIPGGFGPWSNYQFGIFGEGNRATPDMSFNADPNSGVLVYDCAYYGRCYYLQVGGTSVSSPSLAGIVNNAANKLGTGHVNGTTGTGSYTAEENNLLYSQLGGAAAYSKNFYDVKAGSNGCSVGKQWDYCTGVGSPRALLGK